MSDFRTVPPFETTKVEASGKSIGNDSYWKLYYVENSLRVVINSVLSKQIGPDWWDIAVDNKIRERSDRFRQEYLRRPWHTFPGSHGIYYVFLRDLGEIMRANSHLFQDEIDDVDGWIARIEQLRLPRNIVGHMNFPSDNDKARIGVMYEDCKALIGDLSRSQFSLAIPS